MATGKGNQVLCRTGVLTMTSKAETVITKLRKLTIGSLLGFTVPKRVVVALKLEAGTYYKVDTDDKKRIIFTPIK